MIVSVTLKQVILDLKDCKYPVFMFVSYKVCFMILFGPFSSINNHLLLFVFYWLFSVANNIIF